MKKKKFLAVALTTCMAFTATLGGCSLVSVNSNRDMELTIATVDISKSENFSEDLAKYQGAITSNSEIKKRDLITYFINAGYSYVQNGYTYEATFNMLLDALVNNAVLVQYSTLQLLKYKVEQSEGTLTAEQAVTAFVGAATDYGRYEYLLGADSDDVLLAKYNLYSSINSAIDRYEKTIIDEDEEYKGIATRTTPKNVDTEQDDYYPKDVDNHLNYNIYTGYVVSDKDYSLENSGIYKDDALDGTTNSTRKKAYNSFLNNLRRNNLIDGAKEADNITDVLAISYIQKEYVSQLQSRVISRYYDIYEEEQSASLRENSCAYINSVYENLLDVQKKSYDKSYSEFETALGNMGDTSFVLYTPDTSDSDWYDENDSDNLAQYGLVYNILLPFDAQQSVDLSIIKAQQTATGDDDTYFKARNDLLKNIKTEDQRGAWFNGSTKYAFEPEESVNFFGKEDGRSYLFFENNLTNSKEGERYKPLQAYYGEYSYNGSVYENVDGSYTLISNPLDIDGMLEEFSDYLDHVLGNGSVSYEKTAGYYNHETYKDADDEIDYSKFVYASGKVKPVNENGFKLGDLFNVESVQYKAMSAVNELQYAYTTDTGVLSQYAGYSVSAYDTSYIKEFEYAAKKAVAGGAGSFTVCAGDYGWHLIYVTCVFESGKNNYAPDWEANIDKEGTFENLFFEWIKSSDLADITTIRRNKILNDFNTSKTVVKDQKKYQDLLDLDKN